MTKELQLAKQALDAALREKEFNKSFIENLGPAIASTIQSSIEGSLASFVDRMAESSKMTKEELLDAVSKIKIDVPKIDMPEVKIPALDLTELKQTVAIKESEPVNVNVNLEIV